MNLNTFKPHLKQVLLLILTVWSLQGFGQKSFYKNDIHLKFDGGLILGINFTQVDGDSYYGYNKVGLNAGGIVLVHFTPSFGAGMELLYSQKGSRSVGSNSSSTTGVFDEVYTMKLNYVEVPVLLHYTFHRVDFEAGISYAYLINSSESAEISGQQVIIDPGKNKFNNTDLEYILGFNARAYKKLYIDCRFAYSITPIRSTERIPVGFSYGNIGQFNNLFVLRAMYVL